MQRKNKVEKWKGAKRSGGCEGSCSSPGVEICQRLERVGGADEFVEDADNVCEFGAAGAFLLPALHHQLVHSRGAVQWGGQAEAFIDGFHHLSRHPGNGRNKETCLTKPPE